MYNVYQHWDPLKVCIVGRSYNPEFYSFIKNDRVRVVLERIAKETEEDYQKLITLLESFGVKVLRPDVIDDYKYYLNKKTGKIKPPPMTPRDYSIMLGDEFLFSANSSPTIEQHWELVKGADWPSVPPSTYQEFLQLPELVKKEINDMCGDISDYENADGNLDYSRRIGIDDVTWGSVLKEIKEKNTILSHVSECQAGANAATITRIGKDLYHGTTETERDVSEKIKQLAELYPQYRWHGVDTEGHSDGSFCPVVPGLIVSLYEIQNYTETFPGWEVVYLPEQRWDGVRPFLNLKEKNKGKWWVPGEELNDDFTEFVEGWLEHWVGYVEETVFDVNMLVIDKKNVVCNNYNKEVFEAFERHGVTPHIINFRHRYFWDGGLHCITSDVHREGVMEDYFPERK